MAEMSPLEQSLQAQLAMSEQIKNSGLDDRHQAAIGGMTPEEQAEYFRDYAGEQGAQDRQLEMANALKATSMPTGRQVGNQFIASNPWEGVANVAQKAVGHYKGNQAEAEKKKLGATEKGAQQRLAQALLAQKQMQEMGQGAQGQLMPVDNGMRTA